MDYVSVEAAMDELAPRRHFSRGPCACGATGLSYGWSPTGPSGQRPKRQPQEEGHAWAPDFCSSTRQTPPTGRCSHVPSTPLVTLKSSARATSLRSAAESVPAKPGLAASGWTNGTSLALRGE